MKSLTKQWLTVTEVKLMRVLLSDQNCWSVLIPSAFAM